MQISNMFWTILLFFSILSCKQAHSNGGNGSIEKIEEVAHYDNPIVAAADRPEQYLDLLEDKKVGLVINQTSRVGTEHLLDYLISEQVSVVKLFAPEHGFRGQADAGEKISSQIDSKTGLEIKSLYGKTKKPSAEDLNEIDLMVFDIQDVGVRFYTYISTLHYVMEACAENDIPLVVLDRPNPNGHYVDGPVLESEFSSFVGMHSVPVVYGMTIGEYAYMINGEKWLTKGIQCDLTVIPCDGYTHSRAYDLPIKPSPNLPNRKAILHYPSLCFFEGTTFSIGRGTDSPFQLLGHPQWTEADFVFKPISRPGAKYPKHEGKQCSGLSLTKSIEDLEKQKQLDLTYLYKAYQVSVAEGFTFFNDNDFFEKLAGTRSLRDALVQGTSEEELRKSWRKDLMKFKLLRRKYLIYD